MENKHSTVNKETARTLQDFKALVEKKLNKNIWRELERDFVWDEIVTAWDEAAELYAKSCASLAWDAAEKWRDQKMLLENYGLKEITAPDKETYMNNLFEK